MVIDFYGYKATGKKMTPEDYNRYITSLIGFRDLKFADRELNEIIRKSR